jgi:hypothetical protein
MYRAAGRVRCSEIPSPRAPCPAGAPPPGPPRSTGAPPPQERAVDDATADPIAAFLAIQANRIRLRQRDGDGSVGGHSGGRHRLRVRAAQIVPDRPGHEPGGQGGSKPTRHAHTIPHRLPHGKARRHRSVGSRSRGTRPTLSESAGSSIARTRPRVRPGTERRRFDGSVPWLPPRPRWPTATGDAGGQPDPRPGGQRQYPRRGEQADPAVRPCSPFLGAMRAHHRNPFR